MTAFERWAGPRMRQRLSYLLTLLVLAHVLLPDRSAPWLVRHIAVGQLQHEGGTAWTARLEDASLADNWLRTARLHVESRKPGTWLHTFDSHLSWSRSFEALNSVLDKHFPTATYKTWSPVQIAGNMTVRADGVSTSSKGQIRVELPQPLAPGQRLVGTAPTRTQLWLDRLRDALVPLMGLIAGALILPAVLQFLRSYLLPLIWLPKVKDGSTIAAVSGATLCVLALAAELVLARVMPFRKSDVYWPTVTDSEIGVRFKPGATVRWSNGLDFWVTEQANSLGFLDAEPQMPKPAGRFRIQIVGDSFVEAAQVPIRDKQQTVLRELLRRSAPAAAIDIVATGYSGTGQANQLPFYTAFKDRLRPDVVILEFVANDFANNSPLLEAVRNGWAPERAPRPFYRPDGSYQAVTVDWKKYALQGGTPAQRVKELAKAFPAYAAAFGHWDIGQMDIDNMFWAKELPLAFTDALASTRHALAEWKRLSQQDGFRLVVAATDTLKPAYIAAALRDNQFNRLRAITDALDVELVDLAPHMAKSGSYAQARWRHDGHWNADGHRWAAEALLQHLQANRILASSHR